MNEKIKNRKRILRLTFSDDQTLEEVRHFRLTKGLLFTVIGGIFLIIIILVFLLLVLTPLNMLIPERASLGMKNKIIEQSLMIDSIENRILSEEKYLTELKNILDGNIKTDSFSTEKLYNDTTLKINMSDFESTDLDSIIRAELEEAETGQINMTDSEIKDNLKNLHFIVPLKGIVSNEFNIEKSHLGIDIVPGNDETVLATLSGTVILSTWSVETGYIIAIQHNWNLISFYKHNSVILKKVGDRVKTGESIAIVGNSGEQTTGPHLHFEMWHNGTPVNPRDYITF
jgi:murein DD-endopeptidase MepM/ murein hydrolase activator NlpD